MQTFLNYTNGGYNSTEVLDLPDLTYSGGDLSDTIEKIGIVKKLYKKLIMNQSFYFK